MKIKIQYILAAFLLIFAVSCTDDFEEINTNPNAPTSVPTAYMFTNAMRNTMDLMNDTWWNGRFGLLYAQYWSQIVYTEEGRYQPRTGNTNAYWAEFYEAAMNFQYIIDQNSNEATSDLAAASGSNANQIAVARIMKVYIFHMMTDVWGDIPYTEALMGADNPAPVYTPQSDVYADLLKELTEAQAQIEESGAGVEGDIIYFGDMSLWKKFANSLRMRVALRKSKVDSNYETEVQAAYSAGVFESSDDDAKFDFVATSPNYNPLYEDFYEGGRRDFAVSEPLLSRMNTLNDPRVSIYAQPSVNDTLYKGMPYGLNNDDATSTSGSSGDNVSLPGTEVLKADASAPMMDYAEVCFIMSEINDWDQTWYENGVRASCEAWGVADADIDTYVTSLPAASAETVGTQKWIALYMQGLQGWFEWRRTGQPALEGPSGTVLEDLGNRPIPSRRFYPDDEQLLNGVNYKAVVASQGADNLATRVWWDQ